MRTRIEAWRRVGRVVYASLVLWAFCATAWGHAMDGLVLYYSFDADGGETATDLSGMDNHGTVYHAVHTDAGREGGAMVFNGTNAYIDAGNADSLQLQSNFTLALWIKPQPGNQYTSALISRSRGYPEQSKRALEFMVNLDRMLGAYFWNQSTEYLVGTLKTPLIGWHEWVHVVLQHDGDRSNQMRFFLNGIEQHDISSSASSVHSVPVIRSISENLRLGCFRPGAEHFHGLIDEVMIFDRVLTPAEIAGLVRFRLNYAAGDHGAVTGDLTQTVAHGGDGSTVEAVPDPGYRFDRWSDGVAENPRRDVEVLGDVTVEAWFVAEQILALTPTNRTHTSDSAIGQTIAVTAGMAWRAVRNVPWIIITDGSQGNGDGTVTYRVDANMGAARNGTISVSGGGITRIFTVEQDARPNVPPVPTRLTAVVLPSGAVQLAWREAADADGYEAQRRLLPRDEWEQIGVTDAVTTTLIDDSVVPGGRYAYRVRAFNAVGNSPFSARTTVYVSGPGEDRQFSLEITNAVFRIEGVSYEPGMSVLCGSRIGAAFDARLANPAGATAQHRVIAGLRDADGVSVGTPVEIGELTGIPATPPEWMKGVHIPRGLRLSAEPGVYRLWVESYPDARDPRAAFAEAVRPEETELARRILELESRLPGQNDIYVKVAEVAGAPGSIVGVPISIGAMGGENALGFSLVYDATQLALIDIVPTGLMRACRIDVNDTTAGRVGVGMLLPTGRELPAGVQDIALMRFGIDDDADIDVTRALAFTDSPTVRVVADAYANMLPHAWIDGSVAVTAPGYEADVSPRGQPDGQVTELDRVQILRFAVGLDTAVPGDEFQRADCAPIETRGDGRIDIRDAVVAGRYAAGLEPLQAVGGPRAPVGDGMAPASDLTPLTLASATGEDRFSPQEVTDLIRVEPHSATRGEILDVPIIVTSGGAVAGVSFSLGFDAAELAFLEAVPGGPSTNALVVTHDAYAERGRLGFALRLPDGATLPKGDVAILTLSFRVARGAAQAVTEIRIISDPAPALLSSGSGAAIRMAVQGAFFTLDPLTVGDLPEAVNDLTAVIEGHDRVNLSWTPVNDAEGYRIYRQSSAEAWSLLAEPSGSTASYTDHALQPGLRYRYRIESINSAGASSSPHQTVEMPTRYRLWADEFIGLDLDAPAQDASGDGIANYFKFLMGADPRARERDLLQTTFVDPFGLDEPYFALTFRLREDAPDGAVEVDTTDDLRTGAWTEALAVEDEIEGGFRRFTYRVNRPIAGAARQFIRVRTREVQ